MNDQPLTEAEEAVARILAGGDWEAGIRYCDLGSREEIAQYARDIVAALVSIPCSVCSGPTCETTHMICLECGTDYAAEPPQKLSDNALSVLRTSLDEVHRLRSEVADWMRASAEARSERDALAAKIGAAQAIEKHNAYSPSMIGRPHNEIFYAQGWDMALDRVARALGETGGTE